MSLVHIGNSLAESKCLDAARDKYNEAHRLYQELSIQTDGDYLPELASVLNNLGNVIGGLGELEASRDSHKEALDIRRKLAELEPETFQHELASSFRNLGIAELELNNLDEASIAFKEAVEIMHALAAESEAHLHELGISLNNLGCVQHLQNDLAGLDSYEEAMRIFDALENKCPGVYQRDLAMTYSNLGCVHTDRNRLEDARNSYRLALAINREMAQEHPTVYESEVARTLNNLGTVQQDLNDFRAAQASFEEAARLLEADRLSKIGGLLAERECVWTNLGRLHRLSGEAHRPDYHAARSALRRAIDLAEDFRGRLRDRNLRGVMHANMLEPYELLVRTCVDIWEAERDSEALAEALHVAERSRARALMERFSEEDIAPRNVPQDRFAEFLQQRRSLYAAKLAIEMEELGIDPHSAAEETRNSGLLATSKSPGRLRPVLRGAQSLGGLTISVKDRPSESSASSEASKPIRDLTECLTALERELRRADPEWDPDRPVHPLLCVEIQALIPDDIPTAFVQFTLTADTGLALIVTREKIGCVKLPELSEGAAGKAAIEWIDTYYGRAKQAHHWEDQMDERLSTIGTALLPLWAALKESGIQQVAISPDRWLHIFPLHACLVGDAKRRVADCFKVSFTPSFSILGRCTKRTRAASGPALIVGNPTGDLIFTEIETASAMVQYPAARFLDKSHATKHAIFDASPSCWLFLYSGHAVFDYDHPLLSSLILETTDSTHRAKWLTLGDAFCRLDLSQCALAVLNGCESGLLLPNRGDEYLALSSGFLHAGAVSVLASLWAVHDLSSALLMDRFHHEWRQGKTVAAALREAARWLREDIKSGEDLVNRVLDEFLRKIPKDTILPDGRPLHQACLIQARKYAARTRDEPPFRSPVYWAAFVPIGKAW